MALAHDVSGELRGYHGRWSRSADALKRMAGEAATRPEPGKAQGTEAKIEGIEKGTTRRINGVAVHHISDSRVRVGFKKQGGGWDYQYYGSRADAAKAVDAGKHHGAEAAPARDIAAERSARIKAETTRIEQERAARESAKAAERPNAPPMKPSSPESAMSREDLTWRAERGDQKAQQELIKRITAEQKAKTEAENVASGRKQTTILSGPMGGGPESAAYLAKLPGGGSPATAETGRQILERGQQRGYERVLAGLPANPAAGEFEKTHAEYLDARNRVLTSNRVGGNPFARRQMDEAETKLRAMGARRSRTGPGYEMPPKPGSPEHKAEQLRNELASITEQLHSQHEEAGAPLYTPEQLIEARLRDVQRQIGQPGEAPVTVKVPSGSEITMSKATARHLAGKIHLSRVGNIHTRSGLRLWLTLARRLAATEASGRPEEVPATHRPLLLRLSRRLPSERLPQRG